MSSRNTPVLSVSPGEKFQLETEDCYNGNLRKSEDIFTEAMRRTVNPATGQVFVKGAHPGDILRVEILKIVVRNFAVMHVERGLGVPANFVTGAETSRFPIGKGKIAVDRGIRLPVRAMIGVIGTAPAKALVGNSIPGEHGGNMDCSEITAGTSIYLPVNTEGALLAAGDLHALFCLL